ncbi:hypothetical protein XENOCAPTIV_027726 [Xenoophorus captivus]|uniref:Uncharacterized protein n=1 Tax=Xenoophorus captivus TaxID=1517983 RepID=A0ABV0RFR8_9TELE
MSFQFDVNEMQLLMYFLRRCLVLTRLFLQVDPTKLRQAVKTVLFNQVFISGPMVVGIYFLMSWRGDACGPELPTFHWALMELAVFSILEEILFYYTHRQGAFSLCCQTAEMIRLGLFNQCYGVFGILDRLHSTDSKFRQTKQYERHTLLTSLTPLTQSIPDTPKKGQ